MTAVIPFLLTWLELVTLSFCTGVLVLRLPGFMPVSPLISDRDEIFRPLLWKIFAASVVTLIIVSCGKLLLEGAVAAGEQRQYLLISISPILVSTGYREVWLARMAALILLFTVMIADRKQNDSAGLRYFMLGLALIVGWTQSTSGNALRDAGFIPRELMDLFHLEAAMIWGGGLLVLSFVVVPSLLKRGQLTLMAEISRRFLRLSGFTIIVIVLTAGFNMWSYVGSFDGIWRTSYGRIVLVKTLLLYILFLFHAFNRFVGVPFLRQFTDIRLHGPTEALSPFFSTAFDRLRDYLSGHIAFVFVKIMVIEAVLVIALFLCSAMLKHETPSRQLENLKELGNTITAGLAVQNSGDRESVCKVLRLPEGSRLSGAASPDSPSAAPHNAPGSAWTAL